MKFDGLPSTNFTIAKYLARNNDVYYMEHPFTFKDLLKINKTSEAYKVRSSNFNPFSNGLLKYKIDGVNILLSSPVFPIDFLPKGSIYNLFLSINELTIVKRIKKICRQKNIKEFIYINSYNFHYPGVGKKLRPALNVYHCVDPIPPYYLKHGVENEKLIIQNSDVVICTSKALTDEKKRLNSNSYFVPNASDLVEKFDPKTIIPYTELNNIKKPIAGYIGAIESRLDFDLLKHVVEQDLTYTFVFVGPVFKEHIPEWFFNAPNIVILPPVTYDKVPQVIKSFDVCLIPFKISRTSNSVFPLKLFEYLGLGKPVIATNFNKDLHDFTENAVMYVKDTKDFFKALNDVLIEDKSFETPKRIAVAQKNTWDARGLEFSEIIQRALQLKLSYKNNSTPRK